MITNKQFLRYLLLLWLEAMKDDESEQVADTLKYFWQQGYTVERMVAALRTDLLKSSSQMDVVLVRMLKDTCHYLLTGEPHSARIPTLLRVSQRSDKKQQYQIIEIKDTKTGFMLALKLAPEANGLRIYCYPQDQTSGQAIASLQIASQRNKLEIFYWDATMANEDDLKRVVLAEDVSRSGQQNEENRTSISIEPTAQGYRAMKRLFQDAVPQHRADLERLEKLRTWLLEDGPDGQGPAPQVTELTSQLEDMFDKKGVELERTIAQLEESIAELTQCGY